MDEILLCVGTWDLVTATCNGALSSIPKDSITGTTAPTPEEILYVYSWGMGAILLPWSFGYAIGVAKRVISRL